MREKSQVLSGFLVLALVLILGANAWAIASFGYYKIWWLDIVLHLAGGFWVGLLAFWYVFLQREWTSHEFPRWVWVVGFVSFAVLVGVFWEFFQFGFDYLLEGYFSALPTQLGLADTLSDLFYDFLGALAASIYFLYFSPTSLRKG